MDADEGNVPVNVHEVARDMSHAMAQAGWLLGQITKVTRLFFAHTAYCLWRTSGDVHGFGNSMFLPRRIGDTTHNLACYTVDGRFLKRGEIGDTDGSKALHGNGKLLQTSEQTLPCPQSLKPLGILSPLAGLVASKRCIVSNGSSCA